MLKLSCPLYTGNFAVLILGTIVERLVSFKAVMLAFLVLTLHDKWLNKKITLNSQAWEL